MKLKHARLVSSVAPLVFDQMYVHTRKWTTLETYWTVWQQLHASVELKTSELLHDPMKHHGT